MLRFAAREMSEAEASPFMQRVTKRSVLVNVHFRERGEPTVTEGIIILADIIGADNIAYAQFHSPNACMYSFTSLLQIIIIK